MMPVWGRDMELSCCREILVLSRCLNFGDAAEQLYITQSALSKHVAAAEKELGFRIFDRSTTKVELTEAGEVFVENLHDVLESYDRAVEAVCNIHDLA